MAEPRRKARLRYVAHSIADNIDHCVNTMSVAELTVAAHPDTASTGMPMPTTFISHSSKDAYFVSLLVALLDYHCIPAWCSTRNVSPGARFRPEIGAGLRKADSLIVIVSKNAVTSKWVQKEVVTYQTTRP